MLILELSLMGFIGLGVWTAVIFWLGFKAGKKHEAGFYMPNDRVVED